MTVYIAISMVTEVSYHTSLFDGVDNIPAIYALLRIVDPYFNNSKTETVERCGYVGSSTIVRQTLKQYFVEHTRTGATANLRNIAHIERDLITHVDIYYHEKMNVDYYIKEHFNKKGIKFDDLKPNEKSEHRRKLLLTKNGKKMKDEAKRWLLGAEYVLKDQLNPMFREPESKQNITPKAKQLAKKKNFRDEVLKITPKRLRLPNIDWVRERIFHLSKINNPDQEYDDFHLYRDSK